MNLLASPTIEYCEKPIAGLVKRPYYALSNLAFIITGMLILAKGKTTVTSKIFGYMAIAIGLLSFVYDASYLYISQLLDLTGMFIFVNVLLYLNIKKLLKNTKYLLFIQAFAYLVSMFAIVSFRGFSGNVVFGLYVLGVLATEYLLFKVKLHQRYHYWLVAIALFLLGFGIWLLDASKTFCFSFGLLNGRAIFHYLNAISIYYLYIFYESNSVHA